MLQIPLFTELKNIVSSSHAVPTDFLPDAQTVIAYFLAFESSVVESNISGQGSFTGVGNSLCGN